MLTDLQIASQVGKKGLSWSREEDMAPIAEELDKVGFIDWRCGEELPLM
jgi:hypothetical protein